MTLAQSLAQLSSELRQQNVTSREIEELRQEVQQVFENTFRKCDLPSVADFH